MPKSNLNWQRNKARRIMKDLLLVRQKDIALEIGVNQPTVSHHLNGNWPKEIEKWIRLLDLAGYEIREKEEV